MSFANSTRVAVLRGGPSSEYHISLKTGAVILANLPLQYHPIDVFIDRDGNWHVQGKREDPHKILRRIDVVWNALHGEYGEDGGVQHLLESHGIPFTGSKRFASALSLNKGLAKKIAEKAGIRTPYFKIFRQEEVPSIKTLASELYRTFPQPCIIKPIGMGSSIGIAVAQTPDELVAALSTVFGMASGTLVEEYISGKEAVCGVIEGYRGKEHYPLLPVEVRLPTATTFFDFETRYGGKTAHACPGQFSASEKEELQNLAVDVHKLLGLRHYSRTEFIVSPKRGIFFLEADSVPELYDAGSPYLRSLNAVGGSVSDFIGHILTLAQRT